MGKRCFLIVNPTSGGYSRRRIAAISASLGERGFAPELWLTGSAEDPRLFARRACEEEPEPLLVVGGGDGTLNGVLNGLIPGRGTLAVLPLGTANVLARELQIGSADEAVRRIARGESRTLPVGLVEAEGTRSYFFLMAGIGFDGAVVEGVRLEEKKLIGKGAYVLSALRRVLHWDRELISVTGAGQELSCHSLVVCNAARYGGGFRMAPEADIFAPGFRAVCVIGSGRGGYLQLVTDLLAGRNPAVAAGVRAFSATELTIEGRKPLQIDGDYLCHTPARIRAVDGFVRVIV